MGYVNAGVGFLTLVPDATNPSPAQIAILQDLSLTLKPSVKKLYGENKFPVDSFAGPTDVSGKFKFASWGGMQFAALLGLNAVTGRHAGIRDEAGAIPSSSAYTITVAQGATFYRDVGVIYSATGTPFTRVASAPAAGQYSLNETTGVYTFASADAGLAVKISYWYTQSGAGKTVTVTNEAMGTSPVFSLEWFSTYKTNQTGIRLLRVSLDDLGMAFKNDDHSTIDIGFSAYAAANGQVMELCTP